MNLYMEDIMDEMKFRRTHLRRRGGGRGGLLKGENPSLEAVTDADPMGQWGWLSNVMETARRKRQNVRSNKIIISDIQKEVLGQGLLARGNFLISFIRRCCRGT